MAAIVDDKIEKLMTRMLPTAVSAFVADQNLTISDGVTEGEACDLANVATSYPRGLSSRGSRRLTQFCHQNGEKPRLRVWGAFERSCSRRTSSGNGSRSRVAL
ncbi:hypothetical protein ACIKTA_02495 [Hansschlegelia beijingensis]